MAQIVRLHTVEKWRVRTERLRGRRLALPLPGLDLAPAGGTRGLPRLRTLAGEQAQLDWGHFGQLQTGRARRPLVALVLVLSHSRMVFLRFFLDARIDAFLRGRALAFSAFGEVARVVLYDNLKSAVLQRHGDAIRFNPALLALAAANEGGACHSHGSKPDAESTVTGCVEQRKQTLVKGGKLDAS